MDRARSGDRAALEELLLASYDRVYVLCRRMLGDPTDAEDAAQDAFVAAVRALGGFDGRSSFGTWMHRIATNACIDELRRRRRRPVPGFDPEEMPSSRPPTDAPSKNRPLPAGLGAHNLHSSGSDPAESVTSQIDVDAALAAVPSEFRAALVLRDACDHSYEEISEILRIPIGTVRSRIARGRAVLADLLGATQVHRGPTGGNSRRPPNVQTVQKEGADRAGPAGNTDQGRPAEEVGQGQPMETDQHLEQVGVSETEEPKS